MQTQACWETELGDWFHMFWARCWEWVCFSGSNCLGERERCSSEHSGVGMRLELPCLTINLDAIRSLRRCALLGVGFVGFCQGCWKQPDWSAVCAIYITLHMCIYIYIFYTYMIWYDILWYDMIWYYILWYDMILFDLIVYDIINIIRYYLLLYYCLLCIYLSRRPWGLRLMVSDSHGAYACKYWTYVASNRTDYVWLCELISV